MIYAPVTPPPPPEDPKWLSRLPWRLRRRLTGRTALHAVIANSGWLLVDRLFRLTLGVLVGAWVARYLGPSLYGQLAYVLAIVVIFQALAGLGLDGVAVRDIAQQPHRAARILGTVFRLRLAAGALGWASVMLMVWALRPDDHTALGLAALLGGSLVLVAAETVDIWLQSRSRSRLTVGPRAIGYIVIALVKVALILNSAPLWAFAAAMLGDFVLAAVALWVAYRREPVAERWSWDYTLVHRTLAESWPLLLSGLSVMIYMRVDQLMLRELAGETELGLYSAILPFSQAWHVIPLTLCASALPRLAQLHRDDPRAYQRRLGQLFAFAAWGGGAVAAITAFAAPWLVDSLLGSAYAPAVEALRWHALTNVFVFLGVVQGLAIVNERTPKISLLKTLCGAVVSVLVNWILIPHWGAVGAACAAIAAYLVSAVLSNAVLAPHILRMQLNALFRPFHA